MTKPTTVDEYLTSFEHPALGHLQALREIALAHAPLALEELRWGNPAYLHPRGTILFAFSGHRSHTNFVFTPSTREAFTEDLAQFSTGKGSVRLPYPEPIPAELLGRMIAYRINEFELDGINWM